MPPCRPSGVFCAGLMLRWAGRSHNFVIEALAMPLFVKNQFCRLASLGALLTVMIAPGGLRARTIDLNSNGMSDIWELIYGASCLDPNGYADVNGVSNGGESIAGTNPFDPNSVPKITVTGSSSTNFTVSMACALGKQ